MTLVVDSNVVIKWYVSQTDRKKALAVQAFDGPLIAPTLLLSELTSALWQHIRAGDISLDQARGALVEAPNSFAGLITDDELAEEALSIAARIDHPPYDCFYLALAEREGAKLVTADQSFYDKLFKKRRTKHVVMLHNWSPQ